MSRTKHARPPRRKIRPENYEALINAARDIVFLHVAVGRIFVDPHEAKLQAALRRAITNVCNDRGTPSPDDIISGRTSR